MDVFIDIETAPTEEQWYIDQIEITAPGNYKKPESIQKWLDENAQAERQKVVDKTALDTSLAKIICIGFSIEGGKVFSVTGDETDLLSEFFLRLFEYRDIRLIGHNILAFDIPLIFHRAIINGLRPHKAFHMHYKPWAGECFDTMVEWCGPRDRISQDKLAKLFGLECQQTTGADIPQMYKEGRIAEIAEKCAFDVNQNREIYRRIVGQ